MIPRGVREYCCTKCAPQPCTPRPGFPLWSSHETCALHHRQPNWARGNDIPRPAMSEYHVLKDLAIIFAVSLLVILVFHRIKLPALPGFIVAGVLLGPNALGL